MAKIIGNTTATPNPRPDWNQSDETKADYIKNKPCLATNPTNSAIAAYAYDVSTKSSTLRTDNPITDKDCTNKAFVENLVKPLSERVSNIESLTLMYIEDTAVAYEKLVPADVGKYALVKRVGGILKKSHNLLNVADATAFRSEQVTIDGDVIKIAPASSLYGIQFLNASEIFEVGKTYYFTASPSQSYGGTGFRFIYTDKSTSAIRQSGVLTVEKEISTLVYYISWGTGFDAETTISNIQAVEGDVDLPYEPYWEGIREAKVTAIKSVGANLFDLNKIEKISLEKITIIDNEVHIAAGSVIYGFDCKVNSNLLEIGKTYYFGANVSRPEKYGYSIKYKDGERIPNILNKAFTITKKVDKIDFYIGYGVAYDTETVISDIQIIKGTTAQPYTPYVEHTLPIPEAVQAIHGYGWGVNESANNYIDFEKQQFVQSVEKIDLGSLTWSKITGSESTTFQTPIENIKPVYEGDFASCVCEKYDTLPYYALYYSGDSGIAVDYNGNLAVLDSAYSDVTSFKEAMNGVFAYIELAEPIITDISDLLSSDNFIEVEGGGVIAFENEHKTSVPNNTAYVTRKE